jgi:hypothetical protein
VNEEDERLLSKELRRVVYIPNGVDISLYSKIAPKIAPIRKTVIVRLFMRTSPDNFCKRNLCSFF